MYGPEESPERKKASVNISLSFSGISLDQTKRGEIAAENRRSEYAQR